MSAYTDFQKFVNDLEASSTFKSWCSLHGADCASWKAYRSGVLTLTPPPSPPSLGTSYGKALVDVGIMAINAGLVAPPPPPPLTAAFTYSISGLVVTFTDTSTAGSGGPISGWAWDFGDGGASSAQNPPPHTYAAAGTYNVQLTVTSPDGTAHVTHPVTVTAVGPGTTLDWWISQTSFSRPAFSPSRTVQYHDESSFRAAITNMQAGDLIEPLPGCGEILISSGSGAVFHLLGKNPASTTVIDLGTTKSVWDPGAVGGDYVTFRYTGTGNFSAFWLDSCSNLRIYGGNITTGVGGVGLLVTAPCHNILWYDFYVHNVGDSGVAVRHGATGAANRDLLFRGEVNRYALNPSFDSHADKGTGIHACILHGGCELYGTSPGSCRFSIYGHDPLKPGEVSAGKTWPEGAGGSVIEQGDAISAENYANTVLDAYGENTLMICNGTNPGSTAKQTGGNVINWWGSAPLNANRCGALAGVNISGQVSHGSSGGWHPGSPAITVDHGRSDNTNQAYPLNGLSSSTDPYDRRWGIVYNDCT